MGPAVFLTETWAEDSQQENKFFLYYTSKTRLLQM